MADDLEVELKLSVAPGDVEALLAADWVRAATPAAIPLAATYFDTPDEELRRAGFALRVRREGDRVVQTVKAVGEGAAGLFARPEWECALEAGETMPRLDPAASPLGEMLPATVLGGLAPAFVTAVQRIEARIARDGAVIALAIDRGTVSAGERRVALCEVELELKSGTPAALFALARAVDAAAPARLGVMSKSERGYALAAGAGARAVRAEPIALDPDMPAAQAFARIAHACLRQFRLNEDRLAEADDADALHQARVGLRRLRSALSLFKPLFACDPQARHHRDRLRWLQQILGEARDIDVLATRLDAGDAAARIALARAEAYAAVDTALASAQARAILLDFAEWLATGTWRDGKPGGKRIGKVAAAILARHRRRIRTRGRHLATLDDERRHAVRIEAKKLRYAAEFFAALYPDGKPARRHRRFAKAVEAVQDSLGALNDLATAPALIARFDLPAPVPADRDALLAEAVAAWETLAEARRFWK